MTGRFARVVHTLIVGFIFSGLVFPETVLWEERADHTLSRVVLISDGEFTDQSLTRICRRVMREEPAKFLSLAIVTDSQQRFDLSYAYDIPTSAWARNCMRAATLPVRAAEMVALGGNVVIRVRDGLNTRRIVLDGKDPLQDFRIRCGNPPHTIQQPRNHPVCSVCALYK